MRLHIEEITVDLKDCGTLKKFWIKSYMFLFDVFEKACFRYQRATANDYPEKPRDFLFHDAKENPMFQEFTYLEKNPLFKSILLKKQPELKIIYLRKIVILLQIIPNISERILKDVINNLYKQEKIICSDVGATSHVNQHEPSITLPNCAQCKIHKIILLKQDDNHITHFDLHSLITSEKITTHFLKEKEYYFILNNLLTINETHNYLCFREDFLKKEKNAFISEYKLLEKYTHHEESKKDFLTALSQLDLIKLKVEDWNNILMSLYKSTIGESLLSKQAYYFCLVHLANLRLHQAIQFQEKFNRVYNKIKSGRAINLNDIESVDFGFVFIPENNPNIDREMFTQKYNIFLNSYRYQKQLTGCIAIVFVPYKDSDGNRACKAFWWVHHYDYAQPVDE